MPHPSDPAAAGLASREAGERMLADFIPRMGARYAARRNFDRGPARHEDVSRLSPYLRRRLVLERDTVAAALAEHGLWGSETFIQEVIWRGYFKGWMERRPTIWARYRSALAEDLSRLEAMPDLALRLSQAEAGQTGLACFDAWARELCETGYLHNHARMWFASIWIFSLRLPWRLGADFFYRHLLDGDPASNTLSWRWVAGLHTRGKFYAADAGNIARYTEGRFTPDLRELAEVTEGLEAEEPEGLPPVAPLRAITAPQPGVPTALLITEEDCRVEDFDLAGLDLRGAAVLPASSLRSPRPVCDLVARFEEEALTDAATRSGFAGAFRLGSGDPAALAEWARGLGARQIATPYLPVGPLRDWIASAEGHCADRGVMLCEVMRDWDRAIWPHATAGFFKVKKRIPSILDHLGLLRGGAEGTSSV